MTIRNQTAVLFTAPVALISLAMLVAAGELSLSASTPEVRVSTRPDGRNFMRLPGLSYEFVVNAVCPDGLSPESISLSIADTRITNPLNDSAAAQVPLTVNVPASQIGPVAVDQFCTTDTIAQEGHHTLHLASVLSAQSALLCVGEADNDMTYASTSLDVLLRCEVEGDVDAESIRR